MVGGPRRFFRTSSFLVLGELGLDPEGTPFYPSLVSDP